LYSRWTRGFLLWLLAKARVFCIPVSGHRKETLSYTALLFSDGVVCCRAVPFVPTSDIFKVSVQRYASQIRAVSERNLRMCAIDLYAVKADRRRVALSGCNIFATVSPSPIKTFLSSSVTHRPDSHRETDDSFYSRFLRLWLWGFNWTVAYPALMNHFTSSLLHLHINPRRHELHAAIRRNISTRYRRLIF